ncbi:hypothetical protein CLV30_106254 [Haloactinopolyspora alba]|uniref:Uncharacterized protein n=1 Tax=Haloactinopolyspora alba TaxID=648780 RepID=A0A2P8E442_9ACTN|nr:hypothetical protein [Haloactinopolyspora alba]PSL04248.1 hypothetical protein CLV30_106254 [Haloactinopolyspora alba]
MSMTQMQRREAVLREASRRARERESGKAERRAATLRAAARLRWAASTGASYGR